MKPLPGSQKVSQLCWTALYFFLLYSIENTFFYVIEILFVQNIFPYIYSLCVVNMFLFLYLFVFIIIIVGVFCS